MGYNRDRRNSRRRYSRTELELSKVKTRSVATDYNGRDHQRTVSGNIVYGIHYYSRIKSIAPLYFYKSIIRTPGTNRLTYGIKIVFIIILILLSGKKEEKVPCMSFQSNELLPGKKESKKTMDRVN